MRDKTAIIGSPGAGKSTLAQQLGESLNMEIIHLDRYFWRPDWREKPRDARIEILKDLVRMERWIIEGTHLGASAPVLATWDIRSEKRWKKGGAGQHGVNTSGRTVFKLTVSQTARQSNRQSRQSFSRASFLNGCPS